MSEQQNKKEKKKFTWFKKPMTKENKQYLFTAIGCAVALLVIIMIAIMASNQNKIGNQLKNSGINPTPDSTTSESAGDNGGNETVVTTPEGMISPIESVSVLNDFGFYYNQTLNSYYEHVGVDFSAAVGTEVLAVDDGKIESIYKDDLLSGTEITINHGDGIRTVYRFVDEVETLKVGDKVEKGDVIATVAEANGEEYKDGPHLHFEVLKNGESVDPADYLTLEEK